MPSLLEEYSNEELVAMKAEWLKLGRHRASMIRDIIKTVGQPHNERVCSSRHTYVLKVPLPEQYPIQGAMLEMWLTEFPFVLDENAEIDRWTISIHVRDTIRGALYWVACLPYASVTDSDDGITREVPLDATLSGDMARFIPGEWMNVFSTGSPLWEEYEARSQKAKKELEHHFREQLLTSMLNGYPL